MHSPFRTKGPKSHQLYHNVFTQSKSYSDPVSALSKLITFAAVLNLFRLYIDIDAFLLCATLSSSQHGENDVPATGANATSAGMADPGRVVNPPTTQVCDTQ